MNFKNGNDFKKIFRNCFSLFQNLAFFFIDNLYIYFTILCSYYNPIHEFRSECHKQQFCPRSSKFTEFYLHVLNKLNHFVNFYKILNKFYFNFNQSK